jgi:hypothetical protein
MRRAATVGVGLAMAALALSGCVLFKGPIKGKQVSEHRVQVAFTICAESEDSGECFVPKPRAARGDTQPRLLMAFRVPKRTKTPDTITPLRGDGLLEREDAYTQELNDRAPRRPGYRWFGYISSAPVSKKGPLQARFRVRFRLPRHPGKVFKYRPVLGGYSDTPGEPVDCADDLWDHDNGATGNSVCIDAPQGPRKTRKSLRIPLD